MNKPLHNPHYAGGVCAFVGAGPTVIHQETLSCQPQLSALRDSLTQQAPESALRAPLSTLEWHLGKVSRELVIRDEGFSCGPLCTPHITPVTLDTSGPVWVVR